MLKKQRHHFADQGPSSRAVVFPLVMYTYNSWTIIKAECQRYFRIVVLEKTRGCPLDNKEIKPINPKGNQSWIFIGGTDAEGLKLQYFGHLMRRIDSLEKTLKLGRLRAGGEGGNRGWDGWMASSTQWTSLSKPEDTVKNRKAWCAAVHGVAKSWTWLSNWTTRQMVLQNNGYISPQLFTVSLQLIYLTHSGFYLLILCFIPPTSLSPLVAIRSLYLWVCFCFMNKFIYVIFWIPHTSDVIWYLSLLFDFLLLVWESVSSCCWKWH